MFRPGSAQHVAYIRKYRTAMIAALLVLLATSAIAEEATAPSAPPPFVLRSPAFSDGGQIPIEYTCEGQDLVPPLSWTGIPKGTRTLALVIEDPDVPDPAAPKRTWVHWVVFGIPPGTDGISQGFAEQGPPPGAKQGLNDWKREAYGGPCPPIGRHRYFHTLYALDAELESLDKPTKSELETAMQGHILAKAVLMATYEKTKPGKSKR
jgi:Raf kinase inhibitor-like YbhB/YbcL family protein